MAPRQNRSPPCEKNPEQAHNLLCLNAPKLLCTETATLVEHELIHWHAQVCRAGVARQDPDNDVWNTELGLVAQILDAGLYRWVNNS